jgi:aspartate kinase
MTTIVQKYGGSSLADVGCLRRCAARAAATRLAGHRVVVVVSAMGDRTDELAAMAATVADSPSRRELDALLATGEQMSAALMAMALHALGCDAVSLSTPHLGILTDPVHCNARIRSIDAARITAELDAGRIVVAPGFQGLSAEGLVTTLGRGGSDTTAVAIAAALGVRADTGCCEIYTDVDGVFTADPRLVTDARLLDRISYEEMIELAALGAAVLHPRSVMFGQRYAVPINVRHSTNEDRGTMIVTETAEMAGDVVVGCALSSDLARLTSRRLPNRPGVQAQIFRTIAEAGINVDDIIQTQIDRRVDLCFTLESRRVEEVEQIVRQTLSTGDAGEITVERDLAKVSVVGVGMRSHPGVAATMFSALGQAGIPIANITTSEIKISCLVAREHGAGGLRAIHAAFDLGRTSGQPTLQPRTTPTTAISAAARPAVGA